MSDILYVQVLSQIVKQAENCLGDDCWNLIDRCPEGPFISFWTQQAVRLNNGQCLKISRLCLNTGTAAPSSSPPSFLPSLPHSLHPASVKVGTWHYPGKPHLHHMTAWSLWCSMCGTSSDLNNIVKSLCHHPSLVTS